MLYYTIMTVAYRAFKKVLKAINDSLCITSTERSFSNTTGLLRANSYKNRFKNQAIELIQLKNPLIVSWRSVELTFGTIHTCFDFCTFKYIPGSIEMKRESLNSLIDFYLSTTKANKLRLKQMPACNIIIQIS